MLPPQSTSQFHAVSDSTWLTHIAADPFADADEDTGETNQSQNYIHIRIQREPPPFLTISAAVDIIARSIMTRG